MKFDQSKLVLEAGMFGSGPSATFSDQIRVHYPGAGTHIARGMAMHNAMIKASDHCQLHLNTSIMLLDQDLPDRFWRTLFKELEKESQYIYFENT